MQGCKEDMRAIGIDEPGVARHVARHTFCSWRIQMGFSADWVGGLIADDPAMVRKVYGHLAPDHLRAASNMDLSVLRVAAAIPKRC
jgi:site-specific recombinase XerD